MDNKNYMEVEFKALSINEGFARICVAGFCVQLNPSIDELGDIKTAVSEAVTNCIVHAYRDKDGWIYINVSLLEGRVAKIEIKDRGCGIEDVKQARMPLFTTDAESERSGMGFTVMESFTDRMRVKSSVGRGTTVVMQKRIAPRMR